MKTRTETVETPMPENDDGTGYTTEKTETLYVDFETDEGEQHTLTVKKVSDQYWRIAEYDEGESLVTLGPTIEDGMQAKRRARQIASNGGL